MKLVDRQVLRELVGPFLFGGAAFSSLAFTLTVLPKVTEWLMNGMPFRTALEVVLYSLPSIVFFTLPMSMLLAVLMGVGRLSSESEVVALYAGGVSFYRIALPILGLGVVVSGFSMLLNEKVAPIANSRVTAIRSAVFKTASASEQPFTLDDKDTNARIDVRGGMDKDRGILRNVTIMQYDVQNRPIILVYARRAQWEGLNDKKKAYRWKLYDGHSMVFDPGDARSVATTTFRDTQTREIELRKTPSELSLFQNLTPDQMSFAQLSKMVKIIKRSPDRPADQIKMLEVDRWNKLAVPLTSLIFALLAAPLGIRPHRSSSSMGFGLSILVIFLYWIVGRYTWTLGVQSTIDPAAAAFAPNLIGIIAAIVLLRRAAK